MPMYHLLDNDTAIQCLRCNRVSHYPLDIENRYCGHCHLFLDQEAPYEHYIRLLSCVQACYKYSLGDRQMPLESLQALMLDTLECVLGPSHLAR